MDEKMNPEAVQPGEAGNVKAKTLDLEVKVYPTQQEGKTLATANITLGGCFAVKGLRVMDGKNGLFVAMPDRKDGRGGFQDICHPTTKEMREAIVDAVMTEYQQAVRRIAIRGEQAMQRPSVREALKQKESQVAERPTAPPKKIDRGER